MSNKNNPHTPYYDIYCDDCINKMEQLIEDGITVDLILTDPPYGTIKGLNIKGWKHNSNSWDTKIDTTKLFGYCEKLLRVNGTLILFSQEPYTSELRTYNHNNLPFLYPSYWLKNHFANNLSCKKAPVSYVEDISVFRKKYDVDNKHPLRKYAQNLLCELDCTYKDIERRLGHRRAEHFFYRNNSTQFALCTEPTYNELINTFHIDKLSIFKPYSELKKINSQYEPVFNLKENVKPNVYKYDKETVRYHPTQKPVSLLQDLIETYSNKENIVLDFTMGSGSTGVACLNTNRKFIGIELEEEYYNIAKQRLEETKTQQKLIIKE